MTKTMCMLLMISAGFVTAVQAKDVAPKTHPDSAKWQNLFAADLSDAIYPKGIWSAKNGEMTATEDKIIWTKAQYSDCIIDLEFKTGSRRPTAAYSSTAAT